ncbi:acyl-CoA synthetase [Pikeienuella sp. HZG-20]|uniref:acyl-CoA synthetase n=1 Tax=Paludibacillus litoralis TaxID=3133267 RepID=UPI0030EBA503
MSEPISFPELPAAPTWADARAGFTWRAPARYNIADLICERWARAAPERCAVIELDAAGAARNWTYGALSRRASKLANALAARGVARGDRVGVLLPQSAETVAAWLAALKLGAVVTPLFTLFGEDALEYRLRDSGAAALITDRADMPKIAAIRGRLPELRTVVCVEGRDEGAEGLDDLLDTARDRIETAPTGPDDPALLSYTSGTTGQAKGALHGQRVLAAHVVGARLVYDFTPAPGDLMWTPADWAWMGGSMNAMAPALFHGVPLLAHRMAKFDPERAFDLMARHEVRCAFFPPTALKLMRRVERPARFGHALRAAASAGEAMGAELLAWGREALGAPLNEFYGQTECNMVIGNNARLMTPKPGAMGLAMPGHEAAVLDAEMREAAPGEMGELAIRAPDFGLFLRYWRKPEQTAEKMREGPDGRRWVMTGDEASRDEDGYFRFKARTDDVITSSSYRVGPTEIEECLTGHEAVAVAAVIGAPDPVRTEVIRAFVTLAPGWARSDETEAALIGHVRARLSPHLAPVSVTFLDEMPMTTTSKIMRRALRARFEKGDGR